MLFSTACMVVSAEVAQGAVAGLLSHLTRAISFHFFAIFALLIERLSIPLLYGAKIAAVETRHKGTAMGAATG
ncbi:hypothetical protein BJY04DRAFT_88443 [Aspergillus karnatakaensis]|uniref:uncharacterized protein n=1 Tax=Aspergillus karnatakaensis TaxID=1810916 RepID=UPI003CCD3353